MKRTFYYVFRPDKDGMLYHSGVVPPYYAERMDMAARILDNCYNKYTYPGCFQFCFIKEY